MLRAAFRCAACVDDDEESACDGDEDRLWRLAPLSHTIAHGDEAWNAPRSREDGDVERLPNLAATAAEAAIIRVVDDLRRGGIRQAVEVEDGTREVAADDGAWHGGYPVHVVRDRRPKQLFRVQERRGRDPYSLTGSATLRGDGLPSATPKLPLRQQTGGSREVVILFGDRPLSLPMVADIERL